MPTPKRARRRAWERFRNVPAFAPFFYQMSLRTGRLWSARLTEGQRMLGQMIYFTRVKHARFLDLWPRVVLSPDSPRRWLPEQRTGSGIYSNSSALPEPLRMDASARAPAGALMPRLGYPCSIQQGGFSRHKGHHKQPFQSLGGNGSKKGKPPDAGVERLPRGSFRNLEEGGKGANDAAYCGSGVAAVGCGGAGADGRRGGGDRAGTSDTGSAVHE